MLHITVFSQKQNHVNNIDIPTKNHYNGHTMYKGEYPHDRYAAEISSQTVH